MSALGLVPVIAIADKGIDMMFNPEKPVVSIPEEQKMAAHEAASLARSSVNFVIQEVEQIFLPNAPGGGRSRPGGPGHP